eukprot:5139665-Prymnesium_polylepis.1
MEQPRSRRSSRASSSAADSARGKDVVEQVVSNHKTDGASKKRRRTTAAESTPGPGPAAPAKGDKVLLLSARRAELERAPLTRRRVCPAHRASSTLAAHADCLFEGSEALIVGDDGEGGIECTLTHNERVRVWVTPEDVVPLALEPAAPSSAAPSAAGPSAALGATPPGVAPCPPAPHHAREATPSGKRRSPRLVELETN